MSAPISHRVVSVSNAGRVLALAIGLVIAAAPNAFAEDPKLDLLLQRAPSPANSMAYINFPALKKLMADEKMMTKLSEDLNDVWLVSELDLATMRPRWEAGYASMKKELSAEYLAGAVGGYVDSVADTDIVWSPDQSYLVPLGQSQLGFLRPADRSLVAEWIDPGINVNETGYLGRKTKQPESYLSLMVAIDTENALSPVPMAKKLESFKSLQAKPAESVAKILASTRGVSIIVGRTSLQQCILSVEFTKSPASLEPIATALLAETLEQNGTAAPEVLTWSVKIEDNTMTFQGPITEDSLDGILNIFTVRSEAEKVASSVAAVDADGKVKIEKSGQDQIGYTSKRYFDDINVVVERTRKHKSQTTGARAKWNDQQARKIDQMSTLNVDPQMVDYATDVSSLLRGNALTIRQGNMKAGAVKAGQGLSRGYSYGYGYGTIDMNSPGDYKRVTDVQARTSAYSDYASVLSKIDQITADIRRAMTEKYKMAF